MNAIEIINLHHTYPPARRADSPRTVLTNLNLTIQSGEIFGLLGPNGGGKTTLFRILSTMLIPTSGHTRIFGLDVQQSSHDVRRKIGVVFQNPSLDKKLTLMENLLHQGRLYGVVGQTLTLRAKDLLARLGIESRADDFVEHLSGGLQRRGEIAKGLLHRPALLLMDEPSTGLDPGARRDMWTYLLELKKEGVTILLTTHLMEEGERCDRLAILHKGHVVSMGTPLELTSKIGGDVISIQTANPTELSAQIKEKLNETSIVLDGTVRIEKSDGHKYIPHLVESFPGLIQAITVGKPTLEDVFIQQTGEHL
jgi:ABC-2 type transport system ATP-binding protein